MSVLNGYYGYGFVQYGHSYSVAGLAGHRLGGFSLMSARPKYKSWVRITKDQDLFCRPALHRSGC